MILKMVEIFKIYIFYIYIYFIVNENIYRLIKNYIYKYISYISRLNIYLIKIIKK